LIGPADPQERLEVTVLLRRRDRPTLQDRLARLARGDRSVECLSRADFAQMHGCSVSDLSAIKGFARAHGLVVVQEHPGRRTLVVSGMVGQVNEAFGVQLSQYEHPGGLFRGREGAVYLPPELDGIVTGVFGLDNRPQARPHFRLLTEEGVARVRAAATSFAPAQLATLYGFPAGSGTGECVAIIELGGGYRPSDLQSYFAGQSLPVPSVSAVSVDHASNQPTGDPNGPDGEVLLDIEVVGAVAPGASIAVYFAPNTDAGFLDAITTAVHDSVRKPSVISISWGSEEASWTQQAITAMDEAFQAAAAMGVTVCVASGDSGSSDGSSDGSNQVDFPASSPHALGCGGTSLRASGGAISSEVVWNGGASGGAGGGGVSTVFPVPGWQTGLSTVGSDGEQKPLSGRGVPDVCGDADPETGYDVLIDGQSAVIGGTSAVAPLWAGLIARINALKGKPAGFINPLLYANPGALRDITQGNNGAFLASQGWDACSGLGSPDGQQLAAIPEL
jgi:kumamolisin